jgi:hypothetical protein
MLLEGEDRDYISLYEDERKQDERPWNTVSNPWNTEYCVNSTAGTVFINLCDFNVYLIN